MITASSSKMHRVSKGCLLLESLPVMLGTADSAVASDDLAVCLPHGSHMLLAHAGFMKGDFPW